MLQTPKVYSYNGPDRPESGLTEETGYYLYDNLLNGAPVRIVNPAGDILWAAVYSPTGEVIKIEARELDNPLRLQGQYFDEETGLCYNRYRYFDGKLGAYISADPLKLAAGENLYAFAPNVWGWIDPWGLSKIDRLIKDLKQGKDVEVSSFKEADKILYGAFPDAKKVPGAGPKPPIKISRNKKDFKLNRDYTKRTAVFHKDYLKIENSDVLFGHAELPDGHPHKTTSHINVLTPEGDKATIYIKKKGCR